MTKDSDKMSHKLTVLIRKNSHQVIRVIRITNHYKKCSN
jgi:acetolactate synthase regulatory subunit